MHNFLRSLISAGVDKSLARVLEQAVFMSKILVCFFFIPHFLGHKCLQTRKKKQTYTSVLAKNSLFFCMDPCLNFMGV